MKRRVIPVIVPALCLAGAFDARIASADRQATAAALFEKGIKDLQAGNLELACKELADSVAAWPDSGAKGALAECNTELGRTGSAWELWRDLATSAPSADLRDDAARNAARLEPRLARARVRIRGTIPADLEVTLDGKRVSTQAATPILVDPGPLLVVATVPDTRPWIRTFRGVEGATTEIVIAMTEVTGVDPVQTRQRRRLIGLSLSGAGVAALGVGAVLGLRARSRWSKVQEDCGGDTDHCQTEGLTSARDELGSARTAARWSSVSFGVGAAFVVTGLVVFFTAPAAERTETAVRLSPMAGPQTIGLTLSGAL